MRNVARCWAYETSVLVDKPVANEVSESSIRISMYVWMDGCVMDGWIDGCMDGWVDGCPLGRAYLSRVQVLVKLRT